ncbi:HRDC-like protein [Hyaloraphidium curvatum]|nr:HRDC-like protein [Hyaloraphidium curvatum]
MSVHHTSHAGPTFRTRGTRVKDEEDASTLKFGRDFDDQADAKPLMLSEVAIVIESTRGKFEDELGFGDKMNPVKQKCLDYCNAFKRIDGRGPIGEAHQLLNFQANPLHPFERTQLLNLMPQTAEEAKNYIPSLKNSWDDDELQALLDELNALASLREDV